VFGLSTSQFISVIMFVLGLVMTLYYRRRLNQRSAQSRDVAAQVS